MERIKKGFITRKAKWTLGLITLMMIENGQFKTGFDYTKGL